MSLRPAAVYGWRADTWSPIQHLAAQETPACANLSRLVGLIFLFLGLAEVFSIYQNHFEGMNVKCNQDHSDVFNSILSTINI